MTVPELKAFIESEEFYSFVLKVYKDASLLEYEKKRYLNALSMFAKNFKETWDVSIFSAPGRCEIIGNHIDHQGGDVIACGVNCDSIAFASKRNDNKIVIYSGKSKAYVIDLKNIEDPKDKEYGTTLSLIKGVVNTLRKTVPYEINNNDEQIKVGGFNAYIASDVPLGAGLSSSASFEVVIGSIINGLFNNNKISELTIARAGYVAETEYYHKPCGMLDPVACSKAGLLKFNFSTSGSIYAMNLPYAPFFDDYSIAITNTGSSHSGLTDEYAAIPSEMKQIASHFGKEFLSEVDRKEFTDSIAELRVSCSDRAILRAMHYFDESDRVLSAEYAIRSNDPMSFVKYINQSGDSSFELLQNVYCSSTVAKQDLSLAIALSKSFIKDDEAVRVHGGGFAGSILAFIKKKRFEDYAILMDSVFGEGSCRKHEINRLGGCMILPS